MDNYILLPALLPMPLYKKGRALLPQYNNKFLDEFTSSEIRKDWQTYGRYAQKWQTTDAIKFQVTSNVAPIFLKVYTCSGKLVQSLQFTQKQQNRNVPGLYIYEASLSLAGYASGRYKMEVTIGEPIIETLETDYFDIAPVWKNTVLLEYSNSFYWGDANFATGWDPMFRVEGWFKMRAPASKDEIYEDQALNQRMIFSDPYRTQEFIIGPATGVPDWTPDFLIWALGCDELFIDGKAFTKADGAKFAEVEVDGYQLRGWSIDLRETNRRSSRTIALDPSTGGKKLLVALNVETDGFADTTLGSSSTVVEILSVE